MNESESVTRRQFLRSTGIGTAGTFLPAYYSWSKPVFANTAANDRPRIGCIGTGSMGIRDARGHAQFGDILAVCDVDERHMLEAKHGEGMGKGKADGYEDYRHILDRGDIQVVSIVTPDHWHTKIAIEAVQAGKHVFCQKPLTLTLEENRMIRKVHEEYPGQVFFIGTQQRSDQSRFLRAVNMVQKGLLGNIRKVTVGINGSPTGGPFGIVDPPKELNWEKWLGQAPMVDYRERRCHYEFRWWYEYSGGKFTDWGAHHIDIATWALGEDSAGCGPIVVDGTDSHHPVEFVDGYPTKDDQYNTSHDFSIKCRFASGVEMEVSSRVDNGILFEGERGRLFVNRGKITGKPIDEEWDAGLYGQDDVMRLYKGKPYEGHKHNFYRTIREGGLPVSDVNSHLQTMNTCHLCVIAARLGKVIKWDPVNEQIVDDEQASAFTSRKQRAGYEIPSA